MARPCTVCTHPELAKIDEALVAGQAHRPIATAYGVGRWAVLRHRRNHLSPALREAYAKREAAREETLVDRLEQLYDRVEGILDAAEADGHPTIGLLAAREVRQCLELLGRFLGQLDGNALTVNGPVTWQVVQYGGLDPAAILRVLEPWPEALAAVRGLLLPSAPTPAPGLAPAPSPALAPPALAAADRELLHQVEARRRDKTLTQQVTEPRR